MNSCTEKTIIAQQAILKMKPLALEPIASNTFDQYFAPITYRNENVVISWEEPGHMKVDLKADPTDYGWYFWSEQVGMNVTIPGSLLRATYAFRFKMNPQERLVETKKVNLFWYGSGYGHGEGYGDVAWPLFRTYLDAATNHIHLVFDGQVYAAGNLWPFTTWDVDLGVESDFADWTWVVIQIDVQDKSFTKIMVGSRVIPFPPGYDKFKPRALEGNVVNGVLAGKLVGTTCTNAQFLIDDVYVYADYWEPPSGGGPTTGWYFWFWELLMLMTGAGLTHWGSTKYK